MIDFFKYNFDTIKVSNIDCWAGCCDELIFKDKFTELNALCRIKSPLMSYILLTFYTNGKRQNSIRYMGDWTSIKLLTQQ